MHYNKVLNHSFWLTKNREHTINNELKPLLLKHIKDNTIKKEIYTDNPIGVDDHFHLLENNGTGQTIAKTAKFNKGESSFWVNKQKINKTKFEWQNEYIALSVSTSAIDGV